MRAQLFSWKREKGFVRLFISAIEIIRKLTQLSMDSMSGVAQLENAYYYRIKERGKFQLKNFVEMVAKNMIKKGTNYLISKNFEIFLIMKLFSCNLILLIRNFCSRLQTLSNMRWTMAIIYFEFECPRKQCHKALFLFSCSTVFFCAFYDTMNKKKPCQKDVLFFFKKFVILCDPSNWRI